ncbi:DNA/RNA non-specific endonuclease [Burkholderia sp. Tr-20390]|uniref:DNA/RNA non-specific endonuclease n=1 Tax=Burkholderia sp. Tr-20390 TaxID=2703904 RepID=UPI0019802587|nr:DNA/RNA non-specific endonuclease [Burkholderia sp. Tr-20390]MBN3729512.1 DNA/RNA non-specific endonuclease [Burkholderia sp. Tr-20390]
MKVSRLGPVAVLLAASTAASAAPTTCAQHFVGGSAPDVYVPALQTRAHNTCHEAYASQASGLTKTGIWSAEHLTRNAVYAARNVPRFDDFRADSSIPDGDRAELSDYSGRGYDRGHLTPAGDAATAQAKDETFLLSNMVPQSHENNGNLWEWIEHATRILTQRDGDVYVVTGPAFIGPTLKRIGAGVYVPTHMWKAVFSPARGAAVYVTLNAPGNGYSMLSVDEFINFAGIDPFPAIPASTKHVVGSLLHPRHDRVDIIPVALTDLAAADATAAETSPKHNGGRQYSSLRSVTRTISRFWR